MDAVGERQKPLYLEILREREIRLKGDIFPSHLALKSLCLKSIKSHADFFLQVEESTGKNPFDTIPNSLKTELLGNIFIHWGKWEQLLMNKQVTELTIENMCGGNWNAASHMNFWLSLTMKKPQLKKFCWFQPSRMFLNDTPMPVIIISLSQQCANLDTLQLCNIVCKDMHLQMIASQLKKLRVLDLLLDDVTSKGILALSTLEHLEEFCFTCKIHQTTLYNLCLQLLPNLLVIQAEDINLRLFDHETGIPVDEDFHIDFQSLPTPVELHVKQMILHDNIGPIPGGITMPNLTSLCVWNSVINFEFDIRFSKVTELGLLQIGINECLRILNFMGHQIRILAVEEYEDLLYLDLILRLCPNLEELILSICPQNVSFTSPLEPDADLQNLRVLRIDGFNEMDESEFGPGILAQLFHAPNISEIKLYFLDIKEDAELIVELVQQGQILQKLERFELDHVCAAYGHKYFKQDLKDRFDLVLENLAKHCPCFVYSLTEELLKKKYRFYPYS